MKKALDFALKGTPLQILSATASDNVDDYIYVEAFKEINVREAIKNLSNILQGKILIVPHEEMPRVYQCDKAHKNNLVRF